MRTTTTRPGGSLLPILGLVLVAWQIGRSREPLVQQLIPAVAE